VVGGRVDVVFFWAADNRRITFATIWIRPFPSTTEKKGRNSLTIKQTPVTIAAISCWLKFILFT
jgi:hypothetical protein